MSGDRERARRLTRRRLLQLGAALPVPLLAAACQRAGRSGAATATSAAAPRRLAPTPACDDGDQPTPAETQGPYFAAGSPARASLLEPGLDGERPTVTGTVLDRDCRPVARALLDFWQADAGGAYDTQGFRLRGHQFSDAAGRWRLDTVTPGLYPGRTRHLHVKVQAPGGPLLTTQLYFPGEPRNAGDPLYRPELELGGVRAAGGRRQGAFVFVVAT